MTLSTVMDRVVRWQGSDLVHYFLDPFRTAKWSGKATLSTLPEVSDVVQKWLDGVVEDRMPSREKHLIQLAIIEATTNVIKYAYPGQHEGEFRIVLLRKSDSIEVEIQDWGIPFDLRNAPQPEPSCMQDGGYGLVLIKKIVHGIHYTRKQDGSNCLVMSWDIPHSDREPKDFTR